MTDVPTSVLVGVSDVMFNWFILLVGIWTRPDKDRVELGGRVRVGHLFVGCGSHQEGHRLAFRPEVVMGSATLFAFCDTIKIGDIVNREDEILPTDSGGETVGNVIGIPLIGIHAKKSSWCSLEVSDLVVETIMNF